jgi:signal transduction histidine kinase
MISKSIIEAHGGRIWIEDNNNNNNNNNNGHGGRKEDTFTFSLPLSKERNNYT